ncbi:MAG: AraC family transcriptional regulator [Alistipes putredinis]|nr:MAG: AraC family transcriptional regulator [Alistipes putredinis]
MGRLIHIDSALMLLGRTRQSVANILRRMCEEEDDMRTVSFFQILVLIGKSAELSAAGKENRETNAERMLKNIKLFVTCNFRRESSIGDIAAYVRHESIGGFARSFAEMRGKTIGKYKNELRLDEARRLLASSAFSIQEICYKSGFRDVAHFCRTFRKITGTSPSEYRKKSKYELTQIDADF